MDFLERIGREYSHLTKSQQRIADYIAGSYLDAAFLSSTELAKKLEVDPGTITRFAQRLGYDGYPELIDDVQDLVRRELRDIWEPSGEKPDIADLFRQSIDNGRRNLEELVICNPVEKIERVVELLEGAKRVFILAPGALTYHQGCLLRSLFIAVNFPVQGVCGDVFSMALRLRDAGEGDLFIGLGLTKYAAHVATTLRRARARGVRTIGLVGTVTCPIAEACEVNLICPTHSLVEFPSFLAMTGAIFVLFEVLSLRKGGEVEEALQRMEDSYEAIMENRE